MGSDRIVLFSLFMTTALALISIEQISFADSEAVDNIESRDEASPLRDQRRLDIASILLILLGGVCIIGGALITATMIWGAKLRRLARFAPSERTRQDELWYLKKPAADNDELSSSTERPGDGPDSAPDNGELKR